jgi:aminoglycoside 3-N-acetyltransferase
MGIASKSRSVVRAGIRSALKKFLSQERRTELKRLQGSARKRLAPVLSMVHGSFDTDELLADLSRRLTNDFEILMVHSSFDSMLPMYRGAAKDLVNGLIRFCGPNRSLVMPSFIMGGRTYDAAAYYQNRPFDIRTTPSDMGLVAEVFRRTPNVLRSLHPTCSVCALGPLAKELTTGHHLSKTGLSPDSPFGVMTRRPTAILGLGVEYFRCLTHVHTATHQMGDAYPIKFVERSTEVTLIDYDGTKHTHSVGLPDRTKKLDLTVLWSILSKEELSEWQFHGVSMFIVPRAGVLTDRLVEAAHRGITIFGPVAGDRKSAGAA